MLMSTSTIAPSPADGSDMDIFKDAVELQGDEIDLAQVEWHSANHLGVIPASPPLPPTRLNFLH